MAVYGKLGVDPTTPTSDQRYNLGELYEGADDQVYMYIKATTALSQYDAVGIDESNEGKPLLKSMADDGFRIGFAQVAFTVDYYGWVALTGTVECNLKTSCAKDVALYTSATAGKLDDSSTSQTKILGVISSETITAATNATVIATWPHAL